VPVVKVTTDVVVVVVRGKVAVNVVVDWVAVVVTVSVRVVLTVVTGKLVLVVVVNVVLTRVMVLFVVVLTAWQRTGKLMVEVLRWAVIPATSRWASLETLV